MCAVLPLHTQLDPFPNSIAFWLVMIVTPHVIYKETSTSCKEIGRVHNPDIKFPYLPPSVTSLDLCFLYL